MHHWLWREPALPLTSKQLVEKHRMSPMPYQSLLACSAHCVHVIAAPPKNKTPSHDIQIFHSIRHFYFFHTTMLFRLFTCSCSPSNLYHQLSIIFKLFVLLACHFRRLGIDKCIERYPTKRKRFVIVFNFPIVFIISISFIHPWCSYQSHVRVIHHAYTIHRPYYLTCPY